MKEDVLNMIFDFSNGYNALHDKDVCAISIVEHNNENMSYYDGDTIGLISLLSNFLVTKDHSDLTAISTAIALTNSDFHKLVDNYKNLSIEDMIIKFNELYDKDESDGDEDED